MSVVRIGAGAGFQGDRIEPAADLAARGELDFLVFECLAERTIALAQMAKRADPAAGFDPLLTERLRAVLPACARNGTRIITNMGAANPPAAAAAARRVAQELNLPAKIAVVGGDDVLARAKNLPLEETGKPAPPDKIISANAYIGCGGIVDALRAGADVVICGRAADPALFCAPLIYKFGWAADDWRRLGRGVLVGHLLECAGQISGGYFADGENTPPDLANLGFPLAEVSADGNAIIAKLPNTGGAVNRATCTEQLLYEIHDPAKYFQPDVIANFSGVMLEEVGKNRVAVSGGDGAPPTGLLKVSVGYLDGWLGEGQISYAGYHCVARANLALELVRARLADAKKSGDILEERGELIGLNSVAPRSPISAGRAEENSPAPPEVRMRYAARCKNRAAARRVADEVERLYLCGPAGGGGVAKTVREIIAIGAAFIPGADVPVNYKMQEEK